MQVTHRMLIAGMFFVCFSFIGIQDTLLFGEERKLPSPPYVSSLAAILMDARTGTILYEKNGMVPHPPASLTKVMTIHILLNKIKSGELSPETVVPIPPESWAIRQPSDSSLMFLGPNQKATVQDILQGLAVASGNDAAVAAALLVSGSVESFTELMNAEADRLGLKTLQFVEPSGYDASNRITAREFAQFLKYYLEEHPESLENLHSIREFSYPRSENLIKGNTQHPITQYNRNSLLFTYPGADGIKTGFLYESGYNLAATAKKNGMRLIVVLLGTIAETNHRAINIRNQEAIQLLEYGFEHFSTVEVSLPPPTPIRVWKGSQTVFIPRSPGTVPITLRKGQEPYVTGSLTLEPFISAPVYPETVVGKIRLHKGDQLIFEQNLNAGIEIPRGSWVRVFWDSLLIFLRKIFGLPC